MVLMIIGEEDVHVLRCTWTFFKSCYVLWEINKALVLKCLHLHILTRGFFSFDFLEGSPLCCQWMISYCSGSDEICSSTWPRSALYWRSRTIYLEQDERIPAELGTALPLIIHNSKNMDVDEVVPRSIIFPFPFQSLQLSLCIVCR